jgi:hypothetical protein
MRGASEWVRAPEKGSDTWGHGWKTRGRERGLFGGTVPTGGAHGTERVGERTSGRVDEWGPRDSERRCRAQRRLVLTSRPHRAARGREGSVRAWAGADRWGPLVRGRRARAWELRWAGLG